MKGGAKETALAFCIFLFCPESCTHGWSWNWWGSATRETCWTSCTGRRPLVKRCCIFLPYFSFLPVFWGGCGVQVVDCRCGMIGMWLWLWHVLVVTQCLLLLLVSSLQGTNAGECRAGGSWATCKHRHGHRSFLFGDGAGAAQAM